MIIVKGRELLIPENERYIGTNYDTGMENRVFRIPRLSQSGTDLSDLKFNVNLIFNSEPLDISELQKNVDDDYIYLTWTVTAAQVAVTGTVFVCVTGNDTNDTVKWSSFMAPFYTEKSLGEDVETEYKQLINKVNQEIEDREAADASLESAISAETSARQTAVQTLNGSIESETSARAAADESLQSAISTETSARTAQDASLQTQINQIIAPTGEAPSAAEIQNARIGADGVTYSSLGEAIRTNDSVLRTALSEKEKQLNKTESAISNILYDHIVPIITGQMLNGSGGVWVVAGFGLSDYCSVDPHEILHLCIDDRSAGATAWINYFDSSKTFISQKVKGGITSQAPYMLETPASAKYVRIGLDLNDAGRFSILNQSAAPVFNPALISLRNRVSNELHLARNLVESTIFYDGHWITIENNISSHSEWSASDYIKVEPSTTYFVTHESFVNYYNSSKEFISSASSESIKDEKTFETPQNCSYIRISIKTKFKSQYVLATENCVRTRSEISYYGLGFTTDGWMFKGTGEQWNVAGFGLTEYYKVDLSKLYALMNYSSPYWVNFFDQTKTFISQVVKNGESEIDIPNGAEYVRFGFDLTADLSQIIFKQVEDEASETIYVGSGEKYTTLKSGLEYALGHRNTTVIVRPGTYDIVQEFGGQGSMPETGGMTGFRIGNGTKLIFEEGSYVVCEYTGGSEDVEEHFSVFNTQEPSHKFGFEIIGLHCRAKNIRYIVHDEMAGTTEPYTYKYKDCYMYLDNRGSSYQTTQCIGGGLGSAGRITIDNCIFESGATGTGLNLVSYHNHYLVGSKSDITVSDCYFVNGGLSFANYGNQTEKTICKVHGNSLKFAPYVEQIDPGDWPEMIDLLAWNNEIRSN